MHAKPMISIAATALMTMFFALTFQTAAQATDKEQVLYSFDRGKGAWWPQTALISDKQGNLYGGTTYDYGGVYKLKRLANGQWGYSDLYRFGDGLVQAPLIFDKEGNLYGMTATGGTYNSGTLFELVPTSGGNWIAKVLHNFASGGYCAFPYGGLVMDTAGNFYGVDCDYNSSEVFELVRGAHGQWTYHTLFTGIGAGVGVAIDRTGILYVTDYINSCIYQLKRGRSGQWTGKIIYQFGVSDGILPNENVIIDDKGNLYGTTYEGGNGSCTDKQGYNGCGVVYKLTHHAHNSWSETVLHNFQSNGRDGTYPLASLVFDNKGNLYGTAGGGLNNGGIVFELQLGQHGKWTEKVLYNFSNADSPSAAILFDKKGNIYSTTAGGGANNAGAVFKLTP